MAPWILHLDFDAFLSSRLTTQVPTIKIAMVTTAVVSAVALADAIIVFLRVGAVRARLGRTVATDRRANE